MFFIRATKDPDLGWTIAADVCRDMSAVIVHQWCVRFSMVCHDLLPKWNDAGLLVIRKFLTTAAVYRGGWFAATDNECNDNILDRQRYILKAQMVQTNIEVLSFSPDTKMYPIARAE